jgi:hypothetical protein
MSSLSNCQDCAGFSLTQPEPCITQACIQSNKCSEILDAACISFKGNNLTCNGYTIVENGQNIESVIQNLFSYVCEECDLTVNITGAEASYPSLTSVVSGGTAPYTYSWSIVQANAVAHNIIGPTNESTLNLETVSINSLLSNVPFACQILTLENTSAFQKLYTYVNCDGEQVNLTLAVGETSEIFCKHEWLTPLQPTDIVTTIGTTCDQRKFVKSTFVRLDVTDAKGCTKATYFDYACDCYVQPMDTPGEYTEYIGGDLLLTDFVIPDANFLDREDQIISCDELKNFSCNGSDDPLVSQYRSVRNLFNKASVCKVISEQKGIAIDNPNAGCIIQDYSFTPWEPGNLADQTIIYKGRLSLAKVDYGCPEYTFWRWDNLVYPQLNNQTLAQRLPNVKTNMKVLPAATLIVDIPTTGVEGDWLYCFEDVNYYAWDPVLNAFSFVLGTIISENIDVIKRARRDAQLKEFGEVILAQKPFLWAVDIFLHRYKYELI